MSIQAKYIKYFGIMINFSLFLLTFVWQLAIIKITILFLEAKK